MTDIFDTTILCKKCNKPMEQSVVEKNGCELRAVVCPQCKDRIIHPADMNALSQFNDLKGRTFQVKLRMVGNSHAISIPKEIVEFMNDMHGIHRQHKRQMDDMVRLCFEDMRSLSLKFGDEEEEDEEKF